MKKILKIAPVLFLLLSACNNNDNSAGKNEAVNDSLSKAQQRLHSDSLKNNNPLLILPPDSTYTGDYVDKYPSGIIKFRGQYRFGQKHGHWMAFYPNGEQWSEMHYDKGLRHGANITYYESGKIRYTGFFRSDKQDSTWTYYDSIGNIAEKVIYKDDRIVKELPLK